MEKKINVENEGSHSSQDTNTVTKPSENDLVRTLSIGEDSLSSTENLPQTIVEVDVHENADDENFILNKFLYDSNQLRDLNENQKLKKPIPVPRKLKTGIYVVENEAFSKLSNNDAYSSISTDVPKTRPKLSKESDSPIQDNIVVDATRDDLKSEDEKPKRVKKIKTSENKVKNSHNSKYDYKKIVGITLHKTDRLKLDSFVIHPLVKIHVVKIDTGEYLVKSDVNRSVVFYYENKDIPYITPILSEPFNLYKKHLVYPKWEETILLNEDINHLANNDTIIFFEIVDFVSYAVVVSQADKKGLSQGWHKIAWAFLKPVGKNGESNIDQKLRLQLYYPLKYSKVSPHVCPVFNWWKCKKFNKYPATLYVSVTGMAPLEQVPETLRSKTPIQAETGTTTLLKSQADLNIAENDPTSSHVVLAPLLEAKPMWTKLKHQTCKIPNTWVGNLPTFEEGCFVMKFSYNGLYLACAVLIDAIYCIVIYSVLTYAEVYRYSVHQGLIYDVIWSFNDENIITSSADCTVSIWNFRKRALIEMLPHPSYVYASDINKNGVIATGCYDLVVRIWYPSEKDSYDLVRELEGHKGYVTSLCFSSKYDLLYSSDSIGVVIEWRKTDLDNWVLKRELKWVDLKGTIINQIVLHKRERRLLIHARDSSLRLIDLKTGCTLKWLQGATNNRFRTMCCFSACGTFVYSGGEFNHISVWNVDLGRLVASFTPYSSLITKNVTVHCVQFHPHDNILVMSHYGHRVPVMVAIYDPNTDYDNHLGFRMIQGDEEIGTRQVKKNFSEQKFKSPNMDTLMKKLNTIATISSSIDHVK